MQQLDQPTALTPTPMPAVALEVGPQPIRWEQLQQVSGGSPRGGWNASLAGSDATESPRGGW
jgi:hypothetical protein